MISNKKYIAITGASSGIGMEAAKLFASRGFNLILVARRIDKLNQIKSEINSLNADIDIVNIQCDLSIANNAYKLFEDISKYDLTALINNAGFGNFDPVIKQDLSKIQSVETWEKVLENFIGSDAKGLIICKDLSPEVLSELSEVLEKLNNENKTQNGNEEIVKW